MNLADAAPSADKPSVSTTAGQRSFVRPAIAVQHFQWFIATNAAIASIVSLFLVLQGATDEPYVSFRTSDALSQIGLGCALITLWLYLTGGTLYGIATARLSWWWLLLLPWAAIVLSYLWDCPQGFIEDIIKFGARP